MSFKMCSIFEFYQLNISYRVVFKTYLCVRFIILLTLKMLLKANNVKERYKSRLYLCPTSSSLFSQVVQSVSKMSAR